MPLPKEILEARVLACFALLCFALIPVEKQKACEVEERKKKEKAAAATMVR